jgi:hypothetical protein
MRKLHEGMLNLHCWLELQFKGDNWTLLIYSVLASDIKIITRKYSSYLFIEDLY